LTQALIIDSKGVIVGAGPAPLVGVPAVFVFGTDTASVDAAQLIPLNPVPSQQLIITLNNQPCTITVYTKHIHIPFIPSGGIPSDPPIYEPVDPIFLDLYVNDSLVLGGVLCLNQNLIVRNKYLGFIGDMSFLDTQANEDPQISGLGSRWQLAYWPNLSVA